MKCKLIKILILFLVVNTIQSQANQLSEKIEIFHLYSSISKSLNLSDKTLYRHILRSVSDDGSLVTFENNMSFMINWWYRSVTKKWKTGDQVYLSYDFTHEQIQLKHVNLQTVAWGTIHSCPSQLWVIKSIPNEQNDPNAYSTITLDNGYVFKSTEYQAFDENDWRIKDRIFILANSNGLYQVWNVDKQQIILCEFFANNNQIENNPFEIRDILSLEDRLNAKVLQQPEATKALLASLLNYAAGLKEPEKPIGVFLFIGPTGVGKTELAKTLALEMYGDSAKILRFDMSHFTESHSVNRLIGSPPGYVNHEEGGQLTNPLVDDSKIIVLLDEIEKAHPQVIKTFLPVFDEGFILNNKNEPVFCSETIFVMTSNLCSNEIVELFNLGQTSEDILRLIEPVLMEILSPEFYNRVEPVLFRPLAKETMGTLVDLMLDKVAKRLMAEKQIQIHIDQSLKKFLIENGFHPLLGARPLKRLIEKSVLSTLAYRIIKEGIEAGCEILLLYDIETNSVIIQKPRL